MMGGNDDDESQFFPEKRGQPMETQVQIAKLEERVRGHSARHVDHDGEFAKLWTVLGDIEKRVRSLEVRVAVIAALAGFGGAGIGSLAGGLASRLFN